MLEGAGKVELIFTLMHVAEEVMLQALVAVTQIAPLVLPEVTVIELVPCPAAMVQPVGTVQV